MIILLTLHSDEGSQYEYEHVQNRMQVAFDEDVVLGYYIFDCATQHKIVRILQLYRQTERITIIWPE
jgi:hypothetical protein